MKIKVKKLKTYMLFINARHYSTVVVLLTSASAKYAQKTIIKFSELYTKYTTWTYSYKMELIGSDQPFQPSDLSLCLHVNSTFVNIGKVTQK